jgi:hypothetical protein
VSAKALGKFHEAVTGLEQKHKELIKVCEDQKVQLTTERAEREDMEGQASAVVEAG